MKINYTNKTIELTKKEYNDASIYGSTMYKSVKEVKSDFPEFTVKLIVKNKRKTSFRGLTYDYMKKYIESHDEDNRENNIKEFNMLTGNVTGNDFKASANYGEVVEWFLIKFPAIKDYRKGIDEILNKARKEKIA